MRGAGCSPVSHVPYVPGSLSEGAPPRAEGPLSLTNVIPPHCCLRLNPLSN